MGFGLSNVKIFPINQRIFAWGLTWATHVGSTGGGGGGGTVINVCYEAYLVYPDGSEIDLGQVCFTQYAT